MKLSRYRSEQTDGAKLGQDALHDLSVFPGKGSQQSVQEGCLFSGQTLPIWLVPVFQVDSASIFAPDGFDGICT